MHKLHIDAFGKLSDFDMSFEDGFNCILRENEFGKSTILAFIRTMFYGFPKNINRNNYKDFSRHKYLPWGQKSGGGRIVFTYNSVTYLLERSFSTRKPDDKTSLSEADSGRKVDFGMDEVGEFLFGLSDAEFVNTIFVGQLSSDFAMTGRATDDLSQRLSNLAATGSEVYSFEFAEKNIKEAIGHLQNTRGGGKIPQMNKRLSDIAEQEEKMEQVSAYIDQCNNQVAQWETDISVQYASQKKLFEEKRIHVQNEIKRLQEQMTKAEHAIISFQEKEKTQMTSFDNKKSQLSTSLKNVDDEISSVCEQKEQLEKSVENKNLDMQQETQTTLQQYNRVVKELDDIEKLKKDLTSQIDHLRAQKRSLSEKGLRSVKNNRIIFLVFALIISAISLIGVIANILNGSRFSVFFILLTIPAAAMWLGFGLCYAKAKKVFEQNRVQIEEDVEMNRDKAVELANEINQKQSELNQLKINIDFHTRRIDEEKHRLNQDLKHYELKLDDLKKQREEYRNQMKVLDQNMQDPNRFNDDQEMVNLDVLQNKRQAILNQINTKKDEKDLLEQEEKGIDNQISLLRQDIAKKQGQIEQLVSNMPVQSEIEEKKAEYTERLISYKQYYDALGMAHEAMKEAAMEMERLFAPQVSAQAAEYLKRLTVGKYSTIRMDKDFNVEVDVRNALDFRNASLFSGATMDQIYLALRLSISNLIISPHNALPFFLDDALMQYDEVRLRDAIDLLKDISLSRQVILFTCHKHVYDLAN